MKPRRRFEPTGLLVLEPRAFFEMFFEIEPREVEAVGDVAIVSITGPLDHHDGGWFDSYDSILERIEAACESSAHTVILKIDSPGGLLSGCFETARSIRARCATAGKRLVSYVEGCAASGGYALASAAEQVVIAETSLVGSIGVLQPRVDVSAADASYGMRYAFIASGKRKADGHPHQRLSDAELEHTQTQVNSLAGVFFELVAEMRGTDAASISALEAGVFHGADAIRAGLADSISSFDALLALVASPSAKGSDMAEETSEETSNDLDTARAALEKAAEGEGDDAERAKKALAALDGKPEPESEPAEGDDEEPAGVQSRAVSPVVSNATGELGALVARLEQKVERLEGANSSALKSQLLASRPDLPKSIVSLVAGKSYAATKEIVDAIPKPAGALNNKPAATAVVQGTRGTGQTGDASTRTSLSAHASALDERMGFSPKPAKVTREAHALTFEIGDSNARNPRESSRAVKGAEIK